MRVLVIALCALLVVSQAAWADNDSCEYARDGECDEGRYGGGAACSDGTDATDCRAIAATATCEFAFDYQCDEARYGGGGACTAGSDTFDCARLAARQSDDSCVYANDAECDEPRFHNTSGLCRDGTDATDCRGAETPSQALARLMALLPKDIRRQLGNDSCEYANDRECDDAGFGGTGFCDSGTDAADCRALAAGGDDTCRYAGDNECDEPGIGLDYCISGSDTTDCAPVAFLRNRDNSCVTAFDRRCDEPGQGTGTCEAFSDTADCVGRGRPVQASDHFFGRDDRFLPDPTVMPWRTIGRLTGDNGDCSGVLVGSRTVLTAGHCLTDDGTVTVLPEYFFAGQRGGRYVAKARVVAGEFAPDYATETRPAGRGNGTDWGLVTLDRDLGLTVGFLDVHVLGPIDIAAIDSGGLVVDQAGYSWDTGDNLSGHLGCRVTDAFADSTILHECDTTQGDSGSPVLLRVGDSYRVIAVDSQFFDREEKNVTFTSGNLAVDSRAFAEAVRRANGG